MRRVVADASALVGWFDGDSPMRRDYEAGDLVVCGPRELPRDLVAALVDRFGLDPEAAACLGREVERLGFELHDPPLPEVARWIALGLDPHRAAYAAVAASLDLRLVTKDPALRRAAAAVVANG